jgi:hypothetical protein
MGTQATLVYTVTPVGVLAAVLVPLVNAAAVPLPKDLLDEYGIRTISDATVIVGPDVVRTIVLGFDPSVAATVAAMVLDSGGVIESIVPNPGLDYIRPPTTTVVYPASTAPPVGNPPILRSFMNVQAVAIDAGGAGIVAPVVVTFLGGLPPANKLGSLSVPSDDPTPPAPLLGCVKKVFIKNPGLGYPVGTIAQIRGGGPQSTTPTIPATADITRDAFGRITSITLTDMGEGYVKTPHVDIVPPVGFVPPANFKAAKAFASMAVGTPARAGVVTVVGMAITAIAVASFGDGYIAVPDILIRPAAGTGAVATAQMGVGRVDIIAPSKGVPATATIAFTPVFQQMFPSTVPGDDPNQRRPFARLIEAALMRAGFTPVVSTAPLVA